MRFNALKHALTARSVVLRGESDEEFNDYLQRLRAELRPRGYREEVQVADAASADWRLRRAAEYERAVYEQQMKDATTRVERNAAILPHPERFALVERYDSKHRRDRNAALREFERLQDKRRREARERKALQSGDPRNARSPGADAVSPSQSPDEDTPA